MNNWKEPKVCAVKHKDLETREASRSGGIFTALSDIILQDQGVIYGCVLSDDFYAVHIRAEGSGDRNRMRGSKYIQSDMGEIYKLVQADLKNGRSVLFSGTSCQIAALKLLLGREVSNLLCVDIVCHGVPSPIVWQEYLKWQEKKNGGKVVTVNFRNKKDYGWADHVETLVMSNGKRVDSRVFTTLFYGHSILRPCCYHCPYKSIMHPGDITIADYWGVDKVLPDFDDNKGVSLVFINNMRGYKKFEQVKDAIIWRETELYNCMQPPLAAPFHQPEERDCFWKDFYISDFDSIVNKYGGHGLGNRVHMMITKLKRYL